MATTTTTPPRRWLLKTEPSCYAFAQLRVENSPPHALFDGRHQFPRQVLDLIPMQTGRGFLEGGREERQGV